MRGINPEFTMALSARGAHVYVYVQRMKTTARRYGH